MNQTVAVRQCILSLEIMGEPDSGCETVHIVTGDNG